MSEMDDLQASIGAWAGATFVDRPTSGIVRHMRREVEELAEALIRGEPVQHEVADIIILALNLADKRGFSAREAVEEKMAKNRARLWAKPDREGVIEHVRSGLNASTS